MPPASQTNSSPLVEWFVDNDLVKKEDLPGMTRKRFERAFGDSFPVQTAAWALLNGYIEESFFRNETCYRIRSDTDVKAIENHVARLSVERNCRLLFPDTHKKRRKLRVLPEMRAGALEEYASVVTANGKRKRL